MMDLSIFFYILRPFFFLLLLTGAIFSEETPVTLKELGIIAPLTVRGERPVVAFSFPQLPKVDYGHIRGAFKILFSPELDPASTFSLKINGASVVEATLASIGPASVVSFTFASEDPLDKKRPLLIEASGSFLQAVEVDHQHLVSYRPSFTIDNEESVFFVTPEEHFFLTEHFANNPVREIPLVLEEVNEETIAAALRLSNLIGSYYLPWKYRVVWNKDPDQYKTIFIGSKGPAFEEDAHLHLTPVGVLTLIGRLGSNFDAIEPQSSVSFAEIGGRTAVFEGKGEFCYALPFRLSEIDSRGDHLDLQVYLAHDKILQDHSAVLRVQLNGVEHTFLPLLTAVDFHVYTVSLPMSLIKRQNLLCFYVSSGKEHLFKASIEGRSRLQSSAALSRGTRKELVADFPGIMKGKGQVLLSSTHFPFIQCASKFFELLGQDHGTLTDFTLNLHRKVEPDNSQFVSLILNPKDLSWFHPLFDLAGAAELNEPVVNELVMLGYFSNVLGVIQMMQVGRTPVIAFSDESLQPFSWTESLSMEIVDKLEALIGIYTNGRWFAIPLGEGVLVQSPLAEMISRWWQANKYTIVILISLGCLFFLIYINRNLTESR